VSSLPLGRWPLAAAAAYALVLVALALALLRSSPGPATQDVQGIGIGSYGGPGGIAYLSGRDLACTPSTRPPFTSRCTVEVAGETLELFAHRNPPGAPNQLGGACEARYAGEAWPCRIGGRHVHVQWFAYLDQPLGLTPAQLAAVRRAHPLPNVPERAILSGLLAVPALTGLAAAGGTTVWLRRGGHGWAAAITAGALVGPAALAGTFVLAAGATSGYGD
jgi:hypothetical protein